MELESQLLKFVVENGIIDINTIQKQIEMKEKERLIKEHPYSIWLGKDGFWRTYLPKGDDGRKLVKKKERTDIENAIIDYWTKNSNDGKTFKERFNVWVERQKNCGRSGNTISKYLSDYKRFFEGYPIEKVNIDKIDDECLSQFIITLLNDKKIPYRALKSLVGYLDGIFEKSKKDKLITENPCDYLDLPIFRKYCTEKDKQESNTRVLTDPERVEVLETLNNRYKNNSKYIPDYAVELALYTGMRVGELGGLKWCDIDIFNRTIKISRSEKYDRLTKEYYISETKNSKKRVIPITDEILDVLVRLRNIQEEMNCVGEFVFSNSNGKINIKTLAKCGNRRTKTSSCEQGKSVHAIRRTLNSKLRCNGVSATVAAGLLGHSEKVNEMNYTVDISSLETKLEYMKLAGKIG